MAKTIKNYDGSRGIEITDKLKSVIQMVGLSIKATYHNLQKGDYYPILLSIHKDAKGYNVSVKGRVRGWLNIQNYHFDNKEVTFNDFLSVMGECAILEKKGTGDVIYIDIEHKNFLKTFSTYWSNVVVYDYKYIKEKGKEPENDESFMNFYHDEKALLNALVYYNNV